MRRTSHVREYVRRKHGLADHGGPVSEHDRGYEVGKGLQEASTLASKATLVTPEWLENNLPHGSGIDADWYVEDKGDYFRVSNSFHTMDEVGYYGDWADFFVTIPKQNPHNFAVRFSGPIAQRLNVRYSLRPYLEDLFDEYIHDWVDVTREVKFA